MKDNQFSVIAVMMLLLSSSSLNSFFSWIRR